MAGLKSLAKDTAIYGLSSIVGRFLNYLLVPLYTAVIPASTGGYGVVSNVYAYTALILVLLTFGMETGFFRFANKTDADPKRVYANALLFVGGLSLLFVVLCLAFIHPLSTFLEYPDHPDYIAMMVIVVALDSFQCIPFAYLRYQKKPMKFAAIKLSNIIGNIVLNLFFLLLCPYIYKVSPEAIDWFYRPDYLVGYIFVSNLIMSAVQMFFFIPELRGFSYRLDRPLMKQMVSYSFPILIFGLVGILNQTVDKMIYPFLFENRQEGLVQLGIYSATSKVAMVMAMFTQAFRYAYEPFVFGKNKEGDNREMYAKAMKYFFIFSLLAFLSFWYKLTDETKWGAYFSLIGCAVILILNIWLVPRYGYVASAWASVAGYGLITLLSYVIGQKKYPVAYPLKDMVIYLALAAVLYILAEEINIANLFGRLAFHTVLLLCFAGYILKKDLPRK